MTPKIIHYCWFGGNPKPELVERCMESWHRCMPSASDRESVSEGEEWTYMEWNESNFDIASAPLYVRQAYEAKKYTFVSDYVRLWALEQYGGVYFCPGLTTGENLRCERTYCEHKGLHSWSGPGGWKQKVLAIVSPKMKTRLIKLKRAILG